VREFYVYMMANRSRTLYTGMTNSMPRRVWEHKHMQIDGFTRRYLIDRLVYYEIAPDAASAIQREKQIKGWVRRKKIALIESVNPEWRDLSEDFIDIRPEIPRGRTHLQKSGRRDSSLWGAKVEAQSNLLEQRKHGAGRGAQNDGGGRR
jgi:putative endonuclease